MRTVKVSLEADIAGFIAPVDAASKATTKLDREIEALDKDIDKLGRDSVKAGLGVDTLGESAKKTSEDIDKLGRKTSESADSTGKLDKRITELKTSVKDLAAEFDRTGNKDILKKFRADSSELSGLTKMRKEMQGLTDDATSLWKRLGTIELPPSLMQGLAGPIAAGLIPAIAAVGGALTSVIGASVAGIGVAGAVMGNPEMFKAEWSTALGSVKKDFLDASAPFAGVTLDAIRTIGPTVASWHLKEALAPAVAFVPTLVKGVEGFASGIEHGVAGLTSKAGPAVTALSDGFTQLGVSIGRALNSIGDGAQGGAEALHTTASDVAILTEAFGKLTLGAEKAFGYIHDHPIEAAISTGGLSLGVTAWDLLSKAAGNAGTSVTDAGNAAAAAGPDFAALDAQVKASANTLDNYVGTKVVGALDSIMSLDQATLHWDESLTKISSTLGKNGHSLDEHTAKGQANIKEIYAAVQANIAVYQANINAGWSAEAAAQAYDDGTAALERQLKKAGFTQSAIDGLIGKYRGIPKKIDTDIAVNGLTDAINGLADMIAKLNGINGHNYHSTVTTDYIDNRKSTYSQQVPSYSSTVPVHNPKPHARGGKLDPGWNVVGEEGIELINNGGGVQQVYSTAQSHSMMSSGAQWRAPSAGAVSVSVEVGAGANLTPLGTLFNQMLNDGLFVVKASQVRPNV